jgi:two-component system, NtrC family, sensor histidine kinase HydH
MARIVTTVATMDARTRGPWLLMAVLAVLALGATVLVAQRAFSEARDVVVRGEVVSLTTTLAHDLAEEPMPPTSAVLEHELRAHEEEGLRYVGVVDHEGRAFAEAGTSTIRHVRGPSHITIVDHRVRVLAPLAPPHRGMRRGEPFGMLAIELEPPMMNRLRAHLLHIAMVATIAGAILLAFAFAWSRSAARLAAIEHKAAREQRLVALGSMSSVMAHELRNPLASLKGHAQLLVEDLEREPKNKVRAERVVAEAERLEVLTTSLLEFVRDGPIERTAIEPSVVVERALADLDADRVRVDLERAPATLFVDPVRLARAIHNIVANALEADASGVVDLSIARIEAEVVVEIRDRGPGIPDAAIFEPFVTTRTKGTGLGLAVARRIAEQHEGSLTGANDPAGGAIFRLRFPRVQ